MNSKKINLRYYLLFSIYLSISIGNTGCSSSGDDYPAGDIGATNQDASYQDLSASDLNNHTDALLDAEPPRQDGTSQPPNPENFGESAKVHMEAISNGIGARPYGTPPETDTAKYIYDEFKKYGYEPSKIPFTQGAFISANVIASKKGLSSVEIIVGAHYDSVLTGSGADDNASGVGVMLEVAQYLAKIDTPYSMRFIAFGSEEIGMWGSKYFVSQLSATEIQNILAMINIDSIAAGDFAYVYGDEGKEGVIRDWILDWAKKNGVDLRTQQGENPQYPAGTTGAWGDSHPFSKIGIPYAYFEATNWTLGDKDGWIQVDPKYGNQGMIWHSPYDTIEYISKTFPGRIEAHLKIFVAALYHILTEFTQP